MPQNRSKSSSSSSFYHRNQYASINSFSMGISLLQILPSKSLRHHFFYEIRLFSAEVMSIKPKICTTDSPKYFLKSGTGTTSSNRSYHIALNHIVRKSFHFQFCFWISNLLKSKSQCHANMSLASLQHLLSFLFTRIQSQSQRTGNTT